MEMEMEMERERGRGRRRVGSTSEGERVCRDAEGGVGFLGGQ